MFAAVLGVRGLSRAGRAPGDRYGVRAVADQRNMDGVPDLSSESVDDHFLAGTASSRHPALLPRPEGPEVRLDAKDRTGVRHPDQERAAVRVEEPGDGLGDALRKNLLDFLFQRSWAGRSRCGRHRPVGTTSRGILELGLAVFAGGDERTDV